MDTLTIKVALNNVIVRTSELVRTIFWNYLKNGFQQSIGPELMNEVRYGSGIR